jgi:type II restriction/modification system DNA methylase subunit YeeA
MEKIGYLKIENDSITITEEQARTLKNIAYSIKYNTIRQRIPYIDFYLGRIEKAFVEEEK